MKLLDLPPELLDVILDASLPGGIEGLALTCKGIYKRAAPQLRRHKAYKQRWRVAIRRFWVHGNILWMLDQISRDPLIARYVESIGFEDLPNTTHMRTNQEGAEREAVDPRPDVENNEFEPNEEEQDAEIPDGEIKDAVREILADQKALARIQQMVAASPPFHHHEEDAGTWCEKMIRENSTNANSSWRGSYQYSQTLLLGLLPNIKVLRLIENRNGPPNIPAQDDLDNVSALLMRVIEAARTDNHYEKPLGKLKVLLPFSEPGHTERLSLQKVQYFLTLPTLTEIYLVSMVGVDDNITSIPFNWKTPSLSSFLLRIELWSCCIDTDAISALVSHTPRLRVFKYSHEPKWQSCLQEWNPGSFIQALAQYCGNTITELAITIDAFTWITNGASSFLSFPKLEKFEGDISIFCGPPLESGQRGGAYPFVPEGAAAWTNDDIPCIGSMIPNSIIEFQLNIDWPDDERALVSLLKNLKAQRRDRIHKLERAIIRQFSGDGAGVIVEDAGATLETWSQTPRAIMPEWKRNFITRVMKLEVLE